MNPEIDGDSDTASVSVTVSERLVITIFVLPTYIY